MSDQKGYTVTELMVALFVFGLMISFLIPIFQEIKADAREQTAVLESTQFMAGQIERLSQTCRTTRSGLMRMNGNAQVTYQLKWNCHKLSDSIIKIQVEVQWKDKEGKFKSQEIQTHRFIPNKDLPI